jgi:S-adenosylmethionine hydrolase
MQIITLLSDFGDSEYPAMMKGVIYTINPDVNVIDIIHSITPQNIIEGSFVLKNTVKYFPEGTIHVAVVDPGVGGPRKPLVIECDKGILIGPDNGLIIPAAEILGIKNIYELNNPEMFLPKITNTFHGRDMFAPAAAILSTDQSKISDAGELLSNSPVTIEIPSPELGKNHISGIIIHPDHFGNLVTNVTASKLNSIVPKLKKSDNLKLLFGDELFQLKFLDNYSETQKNQLIALISSTGHLEFAVVQGHAQTQLNKKAGEKFKLFFG